MAGCAYYTQNNGLFGSRPFMYIMVFGITAYILQYLPKKQQYAMYRQTMIHISRMKRFQHGHRARGWEVGPAFWVSQSL